MKKIFFAAFAALLCICTSCNDTATTDTKGSAREKNLAASEIISNAFKTGDVSKIDSAVADDFIDHTDRGDVKGRDTLKAMIKHIHETMKDMKMEKVREMADDDYVFSWMRYTGTSDGSLGMPAGPYDMSAIEVSKYKDGKAVEHWSFMNMQDLMKMMPAPDMPDMDIKDKTDTLKAK
jgi:predicted SnoaL-like aldol condensation-catalyzing enzyme